MDVTLKGKPVSLKGEQPKVGAKAPNFKLTDLKGNTVELEKLLDKPVIISVVPDIDTSVCAIQTARFNQEAASIKEVHFVTVSNNTKEEQSKWCAAEGVDMTMVSDDDGLFGEAYGLLIPDIGRLARSVFVVDQKGELIYEQITPEVSQEPDYESALKAALSVK